MDLDEAWRIDCTVNLQGLLSSGHLIMKIFQIAKNDLVMIYIIKNHLSSDKKAYIVLYEYENIINYIAFRICTKYQRYHRLDSWKKNHSGCSD